MRRDVKIGIAVGLCVVALAVLYFVFTGGESTDTDTPGTVADQQAQDSSDRNIVHRDDSQQDIIPTTGGQRSSSRRDEDSATTRPTADEGRETTTGTAPSEQKTPSQQEVLRVTRRYSPPRLTPFEDRQTTPLSSRDRATQRDETERSDRSVAVDRPTTDRPRTYVVQEGDDGFWAVSQKVYGHGKHWQLVRDANPDVDSNALRAGQRLRVPALPAEDRSSAGAPDSTPGSVRTLSGGRRIYTVQEGDLGFWGVSQKVYGTGKYGHVIAQENPQADSGSLRPGQKLIIPHKPVEADTPEQARRTGSGRSSSEDRTYTVQEGDKGFWGVAQDVYGDGTLWTLIQKANPGVDSGSLKPGQTLVIPPTDEAESPRASSADTADEQGTPRRPTFD
ncbi:MAG: LysM peptidoglycan-binding domain-containing protein [Phycisphaerae bacterium]